MKIEFSKKDYKKLDKLFWELRGTRLGWEAEELLDDFGEILDKLEKTKAKYPADKFKGISTKYNKLEK